MTKRPTTEAAEEILGLYFPVHDAGFVALKDYMGTDQCIEEAARGSYAYGTRKKSDTRALIRSLMRRRHTSPFEQVEFKFHCAMPIFVARQWIRHRTASVNEMSGRYSLMPMLFYTPTREQIQAQSQKDKQGREGELEPEVAECFLHTLDTNYKFVKSGYRWATENDIARELARIDLPLSTYTQWYWKIDGHNLLHALSLRCDLRAQWETRRYFDIIAGMVKRVMPLAFEAWEDYHFYGERFSRMEMAWLREIIQPVPERPPMPTLPGLGVKLEAQQGLRSNESTAFESFFLSRGLTKTEVSELLAKFQRPTQVKFDLCLNDARPPEYFEKLYRDSATK